MSKKKSAPDGADAKKGAGAAECTDAADSECVTDVADVTEPDVPDGEDSPDDALNPDGVADDDPDISDDPVILIGRKLASERDKYLRLAAEYDNFRKRSIKERETLYSDARADTITRLLPVYDNLERALKMECADEAFYKGVEMTMTQLTELLEGMNVREIPSVGEVFDPNRHNAVARVENPELGEKIIAEEFCKGFMLGDRVIRHSIVVVAN